MANRDEKYLGHRKWEVGKRLFISLIVLVVDGSQCYSQAVQPFLVPNQGHRLAVNSVSYSSDNRLLLTGSQDGSAKIWDAQNGRVINTLVAGNDPVTAVAFSKNGALVMSGSGGGDKAVRLWDAYTGRLIHKFASLPAAITSVAFSPDGAWLAAGSMDGKITVWQIDDYKTVANINVSICSVNSIDISPDSKYIAAGIGSLLSYDLLVDKCNDNSIKVWDVSSKSLEREFVGHSCQVNTIAFSHDGRWIASGSGSPPPEKCNDVTIRIWDVKTGLAKSVIKPGYSSQVKSLVFSNDDALLVSGGAHVHSGVLPESDSSIKMWDVARGESIRTFAAEERNSWTPGGFEVAASVSLSGDNNRVFAVDWSNKLRVWDLRGSELLLELPSNVKRTTVTSIALSPDGKSVMSSSLTDARLWSAKTGKIINTFPERLNGLFGIRSVAFSVDGKRILIANGNMAEIWDAVTKKMMTTIGLQNGEIISSVGFVPHSNNIMTASSDGQLRIWNADSGKIVTSFPILPNAVLSPASAVSSSDGRYALLASGTSASIIDLKTGFRRNIEEVYPGIYDRSVAFSPDNVEALIPTWNNTLGIWKVASGHISRIFGLHRDKINAVSFSSDGTRILSGSDDETAKLWDASSGELLYTLQANSGQITSVTFSPDGLHALSGAASGSITIWNARLGKEIVRLLSQQNGSDEWLIVAPDGRFEDLEAFQRSAELSWVMPDDPLRPFPPEIFMRDYYEPRLLPRLLACHDAEARGDDAEACKNAFRPVRPLAELNRIQPDVRISGVRRGTMANEVLVDVEVKGKEDQRQKNGKTRTGVYNLRLFRNGQIVGQWPEPRGAIGDAENIEAWRNDNKVPLADGTRATHQFRVKVASRDKGQAVRFAAYAFNEDRVKSETARDETYKVPDDIAPAKPRAYVIAIGINAYQNPRWKLGFAAKDARDLTDALQAIQGYEVVPVPLVSTDDGATNLDQATKRDIADALALLSGKEETRDRLRSAIGATADTLQKATPDDLVVLAFSGHGYSGPQGRFYLLPSDSGTDSVGSDASLSKFVSSDELSQWLKDVDAGELAMIIDACHSAASVPEGFKPGPMGDRGLGQLAYDKGMRILAATQADNVALESEQLGQGLLTYALVEEGLKARKAAPDGKGPITIGAWLRYAEKRVPELYANIQAGKIRLVGFDMKDSDRQLAVKDPIVNPTFYSQTVQHAQTPTLFDFSKTKTDTIIRTR